jgi:serine/threonine-protein kinase RsbW
VSIEPEKVELDVSLPCGVEAASLARRILERLHPQIGLSHSDAKLLVTEAVTNAVQHGDPEGSIRLWMRAHLDELNVRVTNLSATKRPTLRPPNPSLAGGLGLLLIDRIATEWGAEYNDHVMVWFTLR